MCTGYIFQSIANCHEILSIQWLNVNSLCSVKKEIIFSVKKYYNTANEGITANIKLYEYTTWQNDILSEDFLVSVYKEEVRENFALR